MWWKIYFWIILVINLLFISDYFRYSNWNVRDSVNFLSFIIGSLGIYAFVFHKKIFSQLFWKAYFWFSAFETIMYLIFTYGSLRNNRYLTSYFHSNIYPDAHFEYENKLICITCTALLLFLLPSIYAIYRLGYPKVIKKKNKRLGDG